MWTDHHDACSRLLRYGRPRMRSRNSLTRMSSKDIVFNREPNHLLPYYLVTHAWYTRPCDLAIPGLPCPDPTRKCPPFLHQVSPIACDRDTPDSAMPAGSTFALRLSYTP